MKKKLNETDITNELRDASLYFQPNTKTRRRRSANAQPEEQETPTAPTAEEDAPEDAPATDGSADLQPPEEESPETDRSADLQPPEATADRSGGFQPPEATPDRNAAPQRAADAATPPPPSMDHAQLIETIRRAVKPVGKEATFCRITPDEKNTLADIVYAFKRHEFIPIRTSENEIIRIGLAWLVENYRSEGENSILTQVLLRLND